MHPITNFNFCSFSTYAYYKEDCRQKLYVRGPSDVVGAYITRYIISNTRTYARMMRLYKCPVTYMRRNTIHCSGEHRKLNHHCSSTFTVPAYWLPYLLAACVDFYYLQEDFFLHVPRFNRTETEMNL